VFEPDQLISSQAKQKKKTKDGKYPYFMGYLLCLERLFPVIFLYPFSIYRKIVFHGFINAQKLPSKEQIKAKPTQAITQTITMEILLSGFCDPQNPAAIINMKSAVNTKRIKPIIIGWTRNFPIRLFRRLNFKEASFSRGGRAKSAIIINETITARAPPAMNNHKGNGRSYL